MSEGREMQLSITSQIVKFIFPVWRWCCCPAAQADRDETHDFIFVSRSPHIYFHFESLSDMYSLRGRSLSFDVTEEEGLNMQIVFGI